MKKPDASEYMVFDPNTGSYVGVTDLEVLRNIDEEHLTAMTDRLRTLQEKLAANSAYQSTEKIKDVGSGKESKWSKDVYNERIERLKIAVQERKGTINWFDARFRQIKTYF